MSSGRVEQAVKRFQTGTNCAQSILTTYLPLLGISESTARKMGAGLGGGFGRKQYVCGAVNGASIVISSVFGNSEADDLERKELAAEQVRSFIDAFEKEYGSVQCIDLIGADLNTEQGRQKAQVDEVSRRVCDTCVAFASSYIEKIMDDMNQVE